MIIRRILNNNVVIIHDEQEKEQIVCGKGIAFQKKPGDEVQENQINKIFVLNDSKTNKRFQELLADIPIEHIQLADDIIDNAQIRLGKKLNDNIFLTLSDHIYTSIQRYSEGLAVKNVLLWDIKRFYEVEFEIGMQALDMIEERFHVRLPEDEAGFIALHIVNAEMDDSNMQQIYQITKIIQEVSNLVKYYFAIEYDTDSVYYYRFVNHLKFFAQRLILGKPIEDTDDDLLETVKLKYQTSYKAVEKITNFISRNYHYQLSNEEKLYLTIHIERVIYKTKK
ncbi:BglG family transcription antiterminator LicT [uncultured Trichococcus sp.]|uniref:BglG family transcription antiterminator LicT n=1 Tax=uncultured Trichococcus sp. TaxID=189665 RepID=UPI002A18DB3F|nr:PRD domain-containing protein [uncultured Trichococcus sp.]